MSRPIKRELCPNPQHTEKTESCVTYDDGHYFCFGCGFRGVGESGAEPAPRYVEDIKKSYEHISRLPRQEVRGLMLPTDVNGDYYITWDDESYYKRRLASAVKGDKYRSPVGVEKPLFWAKESLSKTIVIVEGELNALSLALCNQDVTIVSPGSAGDLGKRYLRNYTPYSRVVIIADKDTAGTVGALELFYALVKLGRYSHISLWEKDANAILVNYGKAALETEFQKALDMQTRMPPNQGPMSPSGETSFQGTAQLQRDGGTHGGGVRRTARFWKLPSAMERGSLGQEAEAAWPDVI